MQIRFAVIAVMLLGAPVEAQYRVQPEHRHERILCVVPMIGAGTYADPRRPMFTTNPTNRDSVQRERDQKREGLLGYSFEVSDDGRLAIVEFVASDRSAFSEILESRHPEVRVFRKGDGNKEEILRELSRFKRDLDLNRFQVAVP